MIGVQKIRDKYVLTHIALNDSNWGVRMIALSRLHVTVLYEMDCDESNLNARIRDVEKIDYRPALADIALNHCFWEVRFEAVSRIEDGGVLAKAARDDSCWKVRREAAGRHIVGIGLYEIAKKDPCWKVRLVAVKKIRKLSVLMDIIRNDSCWEVCEAAVVQIYRNGDCTLKLICDKKILKEIACRHSNWEMREQAICQLNRLKKDSNTGNKPENCRLNIFWDGFWEGE
jgi:hypothetical protein